MTDDLGINLLKSLRVNILYIVAYIVKLTEKIGKNEVKPKTFKYLE